MEQSPSEMASWTFSRDIVVPRIEEGVLHYTIMEMVNLSEEGNYWAVRYKVDQGGAPMTIPMTNATTLATTSATLSAPTFARPSEQ